MGSGSRSYQMSSKAGGTRARASLEVGCPSNAVPKFPTHAVSATTCFTFSGEMKYTDFECEEGYAKDEAGTECIKR